jgi:basic membrane lipoprotein Med (substrate-binding protein (PBP1-ABC) superfamily)
MTQERGPTFRLLALIPAALLVVSACGGAQGGQGATTRPTGTAGGGTESPLSGFRVGIVLPTTVDDHHWSYRMDQDARALAGELGIEVRLSSAVFDPTEAEPVIRQFIDGGFDLIVAHSFSHEPVVRQLAPQHPDLPFALAGDSGIPPEKNMVNYTYSYLQMGYTMCWLGAQLSESGILGVAGADQVPYNTETNEGCRVGAEDAVPGIRVIEAFSNDFFDQQKGREAAQSLVDQGADVIFESGGTDSSLGVFSFCEEQGLICLGTVADQTEIAPTSVVASTVIDWKPFLTDLIDSVADGSFRSGEYSAAFQNGGLAAVAFSGAGAARVPQSLQDAFWDMIERMKAGEVDLPESKVHPGLP